MANEADRHMAIRAFHEREHRRKMNKNAVLFLAGVAAAELFAVVMFFIY